MGIPRRVRRELKRGAAAPKKPRRPSVGKVTPLPAKRRTSPLKFLREVRSELSRVSWPTRSELLSSTIMVIVAVLIITGVVYIFDLVFARLVSLIAR